MICNKWTHVFLGGLTALACSGSDTRPGNVGSETETESSTEDESSTGSPSNTSEAGASTGSNSDTRDAGDRTLDELDASSAQRGDAGPDESSTEQPDAGPPPPVTGRYDAGRGTADAAIEVETTCTGNRAFLATGGAFVHPTSPELAQTLNQGIYNGGSISVVLLATDDGPRIAASHTVETVNGHAFAEPFPDYVEGSLSAVGFASVETQATGWMLLERESGPVELPLANISLQANTTDKCLRALITLSATVPAEYLDRIDDSPVIESDAGDGRGGEPTGASIRMLLEAELVDFDFQSAL